MDYHTPVLLREVLDGLRIEPGKKYIDATLGGGGHTESILQLGGKVLGIDVDQDAIDFVSKEIGNWKLEIGNSSEVKLARGNFRDIQEIAKTHGFDNVAGILFDFGVSSHQIGSFGRGFSFQTDAPLDMRMDNRLEITARDLIQALNKGELQQIFERFGEVSNAGKVASVLVTERKKQQIATTRQLVLLVGNAYGIEDITKNKKLQAKLCAPVFQAIRMAVNNELESIEQGLAQALVLIGAQGRIATISFHSLEDRIVKQAFENWQEHEKGRIITKKPITASKKELEANKRSRSAKLRVFEKL